MTQEQTNDLFDIVFKIKDRLEELIKEKNEFPESRYSSSHVDEIYGALAEAQGSYKKLIPTRESPKGLYADLDDVLIACGDSLSNNKICFRQYLEIEDSGNGSRQLKTVLGHASGQWLASYERIVQEKTEIETNNKIEIAKRVQAMMLLGIAPSKNDPVAFDDNGTMNSHQAMLDSLKKPIDQRPKILSKDVISKEQYDEILIQLGDDEHILKGITKLYGIDGLADLPKEKYHIVLNEIRRLQREAEIDLNRRR